MISLETWRLADLSAKHAWLSEGVGWGNMALPMVAADWAGGALVRLKLPDHSGGRYGLSAIWRRDAPAWPAGSRLRDQFVELGAANGMAHVAPCAHGLPVSAGIHNLAAIVGKDAEHQRAIICHAQRKVQRLACNRG